MAHRADILLEAAGLCTDPNVVFVVVGTGAERSKLEARATALDLDNFRLVDKQPRSLIPYLLALTDVSVVHLRASPLFETVIPSKIFEAMAMGRPIILGVSGESKKIVEEAGAGIAIPPEDAAALASAVETLSQDLETCERYGREGREYVFRCHDRKKLARRYWRLLENVVGVQRSTSAEPQTEPSPHKNAELESQKDLSVG